MDLRLPDPLDGIREEEEEERERERERERVSFIEHYVACDCPRAWSWDASNKNDD